MRTRYSNTVYHLVCLELSVTNDCKIELKEVGRFTKAQLVESGFLCTADTTFQFMDEPKVTRHVSHAKCLRTDPPKIFLWLIIFHLKEELFPTQFSERLDSCAKHWEIFSLTQMNRL